jgi:hypothetical protein
MGNADVHYLWIYPDRDGYRSHALAAVLVTGALLILKRQ